MNANGNHAISTSLTSVDHELQLRVDHVTSIFSNSINSTIAKGNIEHDEHDFAFGKPRGWPNGGITSGGLTRWVILTICCWPYKRR